MHIGFYAAELPGRSRPSGIVTYVAIMRSALMELGHEVTVVTNREMLGPQGEIVDLSSPRRRNRAKALLDKARALVGQTADYGFEIAETIGRANEIKCFDVFEMEESFGWSYHVAARLRLPVITRLHGPHFLHREPARNRGEEYEQKQRIAREKRALAATAAITAPSAKQLAATLKYYNLSPEMVCHIPNPVSIPNEADIWSALTSTPKKILMIGRFDSIKGADVAIEAFLIAKKSDPALELDIVGPDRGITTARGRLNFADYIASVAAPDDAVGIRFLGSRDPNELDELRRQAAMVIVPSRIENFPYSVAESMAIGAPTISTAIFGTTEMIDDGRSGLLVPVADAAGLAAAILRIAGNPQEAAEFGKRARSFAANYLDAKPIAEASIEFYESVIKRYHHQ